MLDSYVRIVSRIWEYLLNSNVMLQGKNYDGRKDWYFKFILQKANLWDSESKIYVAVLKMLSEIGPETFNLNDTHHRRIPFD